MPRPTFEADEVLGGHEPVVERDLVGVHAAVAERVDRAAFHLAVAPVVEREVVAGGRWLVDDEHREAAVAERAVGVGAGEHHERVGAAGERAPRLHAVDEVAAVGRRSR